MKSIAMKLVIVWLSFTPLFFQAVSATSTYTYEEFRFITPKDPFEVSPGSGLYLRHWRGPNSMFILLKVDQGKGRQIPPSISRHSEDVAYVLKGSVFYKAGYDGEFTKIVRSGDVFILPRCVPHAAVFGWDANEETIVLATAIGNTAEYGPEGSLPPGFSSKAIAGEANDMVVTAECRALKDAPPVTWKATDMPRPPN